MRSGVRLALVLVSAAVLQRGLFSQLRIDGAAADLFLLLAVTAGVVDGPDRGAVVGFFSGLTLDLMVQTPLGLSALVYCLTGYMAGRLQGTVLRSSRALQLVLVAATSAAGVAIYTAIGRVVGQANAVSSHLPIIMVVTAVTNVLLFPVARRLLHWVSDDGLGVRPALR